jgi:hypothetical protein
MFVENLRTIDVQELRNNYTFIREPQCSFELVLAKKETLAFIHSDNNNTTNYFYEIRDF